jgi:iron(III) transport system substrate-binding protein
MQYQRVVGPLSKIQSEQASGNYWGDMVTESHPLLVPVAQAGFFEKYRPPNAQNLPADYMDKNGTWYASQSILILLAYNTRDLKPEDAPKSWMDLCDTKWIGKFGMPDPVSFDMHIQFLSTMKKTLGDKWPQWIGCIKSLKPVYFASYTPVAQGIATGRVTIGITLTSSLAPLILANEKVAVDTAVIPIVAYLGSSGILKHAPHFNAAKLYLNWLLSNEGQKVQAVSGGYITPAGYSPDYFSNLVKLPQILLDSYMTSAQIQALRNEIGLPW